jgi:hypothetical protein
MLLVLVGIGWGACRFEVTQQKSAASEQPQWRRTSQGWIKVGQVGPEALVARPSQAAPRTTIHPAIPAALALIVSVVSLVVFDRNACGTASGSKASCGTASCGQAQQAK